MVTLLSRMSGEGKEGQKSPLLSCSQWVSNSISAMEAQKSCLQYICMLVTAGCGSIVLVHVTGHTACIMLTVNEHLIKEVAIPMWRKETTQ